MIQLCSRAQKSSRFWLVLPVTGALFFGEHSWSIDHNTLFCINKCMGFRLDLYLHVLDSMYKKTAVTDQIRQFFILV